MPRGRSSTGKHELSRLDYERTAIAATYGLRSGRSVWSLVERDEMVDVDLGGMRVQGGQ